MRTVNAVILEKGREIKLLEQLPKDAPACYVRICRSAIYWYVETFGEALRVARRLHPYFNTEIELDQYNRWDWRGHTNYNGQDLEVRRVDLPGGSDVYLHIDIAQPLQGEWGLGLSRIESQRPLQIPPSLKGLEGISFRVTDTHYRRDTNRSVDSDSTYDTLDRLESAARLMGEDLEKGKDIPLCSGRTVQDSIQVLQNDIKALKQLPKTFPECCLEAGDPPYRWECSSFGKAVERALQMRELFGTELWLVQQCHLNTDGKLHVSSHLEVWRQFRNGKMIPVPRNSSKGQACIIKFNTDLKGSWFPRSLAMGSPYPLPSFAPASKVPELKLVIDDDRKTGPDGSMERVTTLRVAFPTVDCFALLMINAGEVNATVQKRLKAWTNMKENRK